MTENYPVLSICIPTCKRAEILKKTLDNIIASNVSKQLYEICISDNSDTNETRDLIEKYYSNIPNLTYSHSNCIGFMNSIEALKLGQGKMLKLHNEYTCLTEAALKRMINDVKQLKDTSSVLFFSMTSSDENVSLREYHSFNDFMYKISYLSTWSTSFAIWREDFWKLVKTIVPNYMYPHTTLLFALDNKSKYIVDEFILGENLVVKKKGGYNLLNNFMNIYLDMVDEIYDKKSIDKKTKRRIRWDILKFCSWFECLVNYNKDIYTFTFENKNQIVKVHYGLLGCFIYHTFYVIFCLKVFLKRIIIKRG